MEKNKRVFGCDLGTTNSALSVYLGNDTSQVIAFENGKTTMPSCVMLNSDGTLTVGEEAYKNRYLPSVAYSVKKYMGSDKIITLTAENGTKRDFKPEEIGAEVIKEMIKRASYLYKDIKDICITVPAAFDNSQREATRRAGELAGLNVVSIINEPTSASLCYNVTKSEDILVYDLGGGTFDTTILRIEVADDSNSDSGLNFAGLGIDISESISKEESSRPIYSVLTSSGDTKLGGDNIDECVLQNLISRFNTRLKGKKLKGDFETYFEDNMKDFLLLRIEATKKKIHNMPGSNLEITDIPEGFCKNYKVIKNAFTSEPIFTVDYADIVEATKRIYARTKIILNRALANSNVNRNNVKKFILVGGSTENEILRDFLRRDFSDCEINHAFKPYEIVAQGASIQAAVDCGLSNMNITDISPYTIGVGVIEESEDGKKRTNKVSPIIKKDTKLPVIKHNKFTVDNKANELGIKIYQGDSTFVEDCNCIGQLVLERLTQSETVILVTKIDTNGILEFKVEGGGASKTIQLMNVFGVNTESKKNSSKYTRYSKKWRAALISEGVKIEGELAKAFEEYGSTGSESAKEYIKKELDKFSNNIEKTSNFSK